MSWQAQAACQSAPADLFFPDRGESLLPALMFCRVCPVRTDCLDAALATPEHADIGVWGGTSARERRRLRRARTTIAA